MTAGSSSSSPLGRVTIVSGGQTGVDRAALDFALEHGLPHAGWCPQGRRAEDGPLAPCYQLEETPSHRYSQRTKWNIRDSDATVVFTVAREPQGGTALTLDVARNTGKPVMHLARDAEAMGPTASAIRRQAERLCEFLQAHDVTTLNVAGPRESQEPEAARHAIAVLSSAMSLEQD